MKRVILSVLLGTAGFVVTYIGLCYLLPGWRIKLDAEPLAYFMASLKNMAFMKCMISAVVGAITAAIPFFV